MDEDALENVMPAETLVSQAQKGESGALEEPNLADEHAAADASSNEAVTETPEESFTLQTQVPSSENIAHLSADEAAQARAISEAHPHSDIFAWANNMYEYKDGLQVELFLINKNNVLYRTKLDADLRQQLRPLFIDKMVDDVIEGAGEGMIVRDFEDAEAEDNVLQRLPWKKVEKLREVMHWIHTQEHEIELFVEEEHDMKRIKGVLARVTHPRISEPFYVIKVLGQTLKGDGAWMARGKVFMPFDAAAAFRVPGDNQLLVLEDDLYVFNQAKLDRMFGYNAKKQSIADKKVAEINEHFRLSFADGLDLQSAVAGNKATVNKLQKLEIGELTQDQLIDHADELGVDLMTDDTGAIIIMNQKDLTKFVNLLNDDYMESNLTGIRYEIRGKKPLKPSKDDAEGFMA